MTGVSDATERARQLVVDFPRSSGRTNMEYAAPGSGRWMSDARDELQVLAAELEAARQFSITQQEVIVELKARAEAAENRVAELETALKDIARVPHDGYIIERILATMPGKTACLNCGSREQTVVCADCGRLNPAEETS